MSPQFQQRMSHASVKRSLAKLKPWHKLERIHDPRTGHLLCYIQLTHNQNQEEKDYIKKFKPLYNVQHNPRIKRQIIYTNGQTIH